MLCGGRQTEFKEIKYLMIINSMLTSTDFASKNIYVFLIFFFVQLIVNTSMITFRLGLGSPTYIHKK